MQEGLNLASSYSYYALPNGELGFLTRHAVEYQVYFIEAADYFVNPERFRGKVFMFGFQTEHDAPPADNAVGWTICRIIAEYLHKHPDRSLLAVFEQSDKRQIARARKFSIWQRRDSANEFEKCNLSIGEGEETTLICLIFLRNNAAAQMLIEAMEQLIAQVQSGRK